MWATKQEEVNAKYCGSFLYSGNMNELTPFSSLSSILLETWCREPVVEFNVAGMPPSPSLVRRELRLGRKANLGICLVTNISRLQGMIEACWTNEHQLCVISEHSGYLTCSLVAAVGSALEGGPRIRVALPCGE